MRRQHRRFGFTLLELLVVLTIILVISAVALPTVHYALSHRQVSEAARIVQGGAVGARDEAIHTNGPAGIRLLPDPAFPIVRLPSGQLDPSAPLAVNRIIPIASAPNYTEGHVSMWLDALPGPVAALPYPGPGTPLIPNPTWGLTKVLMVYEEVLSPTTGLPNSPTSWFWNIRVGDKIQINNVGKWYTVVGPTVITPSQGNTELFVNVGTPDKSSPLVIGATALNSSSSLTASTTTKTVGLTKVGTASTTTALTASMTSGNGSRPKTGD